MTKASRKVKPVTTEEFDAALLALLDESSEAQIIAVPGVYEALSEAWNNEAIERALQNRE